MQIKTLLPLPDKTYADHSNPAYSKEAVLTILKGLGFSYKYFDEYEDSFIVQSEPIAAKLNEHREPENKVESPTRKGITQVWRDIPVSECDHKNTTCKNCEDYPHIFKQVEYAKELDELNKSIELGEFEPLSFDDLPPLKDGV